MSLNCNLQSDKATNPNYICNLKTGKWVLRSGKIGQKILSSIALKVGQTKESFPMTKESFPMTKESSPAPKIPLKKKVIAQGNRKSHPKQVEQAQQNVQIPESPNHKIIYYLTEMANLSACQGEKFKQKAYLQAVQAIKMYPVAITNMTEVKKLSGVGKSIGEKISIILKTGGLPQIDDLQGQFKVISQFTKIWGVGPDKAQQLYQQGVHSLDDLKKNLHLLTPKQQIGLQFYEQLEKKIPRAIISQLEQIIHKVLPPNVKAVIAGSYRRGASESGDVDILVSSQNHDYHLAEIVKMLLKTDVITHILSQGATKTLAIAHLPSSKDHFRLDLEFISPEQWGSGLTYFTGSKIFNIQLRELAKHKGYTLNQAGMTHLASGQHLNFATEQELFNFFGMDYIEPSKR